MEIDDGALRGTLNWLRSDERILAHGKVNCSSVEYNSNVERHQMEYKELTNSQVADHQDKGELQNPNFLSYSYINYEVPRNCKRPGGFGLCAEQLASSYSSYYFRLRWRSSDRCSSSWRLQWSTSSSSPLLPSSRFHERSQWMLFGCQWNMASVLSM